MDDDFTAIGFMFDAEREKETRVVVVNEHIQIMLKTIGDRPGHVQSGQYLWPAALDAATHLIDNWDLLRATQVVELGAGCGLTGLVASKLPGTESVLFTDYDPGCLDIIKETTSLNTSSAQYYFQNLKWGTSINAADKEIYAYPMDGFKLVVGADLIYSIDVVGPLLSTVNELLNTPSGIFVLVTSFQLDAATEAEIGAQCRAHKLNRTLIISLEEGHTSKVEHYSRCI